MSARILSFLFVPILISGCAVSLLRKPSVSAQQSNFFVLGQVDEISSYQASRTFGASGHVLMMGGSFLVSDGGRSRILVWNSLPSSFNTMPDVVIGSANKVAYGANYFGSVGAKGFNDVRGMATDGTKLVVADSGNSRILIYNSLPSSDGASADVVLGQADMTTNTVNFGGLSARSLSFPYTVHVDSNGKLYVADYGNNRFLIWNTIPSVSYTPADVVIGQPDFVTSTAACSATKASNNVTDIATDSSGKLYLLDLVRILVYNTVPSSNGAAANYVIGQPNLTTCTVGTTSSKISSSYGITIHNDGSDHLLLADWGNGRVLIWNTLPTSSGIAADTVLGRSTFTATGAGSYFGCGPTISGSSLSYPSRIKSTGGKIFVSSWFWGADISVYNSLPSSNCQAADSILGQTDLYTRTYNAVQNNTSYFYPAGIEADSGGGFWMADYSGNRVLKYNSIPSSSSTAPNIILGQPDSSSLSFNSGTTVNSASMYGPSRVAVDSQSVAVADYLNRRILLFNKTGLSTGSAASTVVGEANFTSTDALYVYGQNDPRVVFVPYGVELGAGKLFVSDLFCHRVAIWNSTPSANFAAADINLGQPNFTTCAVNAGGSPTASTMNSPYSVRYKNGKLLVADTGNNRILIWNSLPSASGQAADLVIGQDDFTHNSANKGLSAPTASGLNSPQDVNYDGSKLYITDTGNHRVLIFDTFPTGNGASASRVLGQTSFTVGSAPATPSESNLISPTSLTFFDGNLLVTDGFFRVLGRVLSSIP